MAEKEYSLTEVVRLLRWLVPLPMAVFGAAYPIVEHLVVQQQPHVTTSVIRTSLILGSLGPLLMWLSLTWLLRAVIARETVEKALARRNRELSTLNAIACAAGASLDLQTILDDALEQILKAVEVEAGEVFLLETNRQAMATADQRYRASGTLHQIEHIPLGKSFPCPIAETGQPLILNNLCHDRCRLCRETVEAGLRSAICVPLCSKGKVVGVLSVAGTEGRALSSADLDLLTSIGLQLGLAIENARLFESERTQRQLADTLRKVSRTLNASPKLDEVLRVILFQLGQVLTVDAGLILLADASGERLTVAASRGRTELGLDQLVGYAFDIRESVCLEQVFREKRALTFCDPQRKDVFSDGLGRIEDVQWCLVVPLLHGGEAIGLLTLEQVGHCYDQAEEAQIAFAFANHAAAAIANARLFEDSRKVASLEERERLARDMHDGLVQTLGFLNMKLDAAQLRMAAGQTEQAQADVGRMRQIVGQAYDDLRDLIVGLKETARPGVTLETLIRERLASFRQNGGEAIELELTAAPSWCDSLSPRATAQIANIVQEALTNVAKHAGARHAWVCLAREAGEAQIVVEDDGHGFPEEPAGGGDRGRPHFGLTIMRERAESLGGRLTVAARPAGGTRIVVSLPALGREIGHSEGPR